MLKDFGLLCEGKTRLNQSCSPYSSPAAPYSGQSLSPNPSSIIIRFAESEFSPRKLFAGTGGEHQCCPTEKEATV
jgi:hypothetical protein